MQASKAHDSKSRKRLDRINRGRSQATDCKTVYIGVEKLKRDATIWNTEI